MSGLLDRFRDLGGARMHTDARPAHGGPDEAMRKMLELNPNTLCFKENNKSVFLEDHTDPDGRLFRLEYMCDENGRVTKAYVRHNPWPPADVAIGNTHLMGDEICIGPRSHAQDGYDLADTVLRARHWCGCYSLLREHGIEALRTVEPHW